MSGIMKFVIILLCCLVTAACAAGDAVVRTQFEKSVKSYNRMLRWREIENAGLTYLEQDQREAFLTRAGEIRKKEVTITDYRILFMENSIKKNTGRAVVEFDYYILPSNRVKTLTYKQEWIYDKVDKDDKDSDKKAWKLKTGLPDFE